MTASDKCGQKAETGWKPVPPKEDSPIGSVLVVGGGVAGVQASLDLADSGFYVYLAERGPSIGGTMSQLDKTFPTNDCAMCILSPKLVEVARHPNVRLITMAELRELRGEPGRFEATVEQRPRFVDLTKCTGCGICVEQCLVGNRPYFDAKPEPVELDTDDAARVDPILARYEGAEGAAMPVLQDINAEYGYLPEPVLRYAAQRLRVPLSHLYRLATFYESFSLVPRGRHTVSICTGTACHIRGAWRLLDWFEAEMGLAVGQTTEDRRFTLEEVRCLGCCSLAPVVRVGNAVFGDVQPATLPKILERFE
jgi:NADH:ubiquinone oxidoreductase subunit E/NAD-dependent dihydropyrimidine dehydrogenase PreA subunit